jgi:hypothetical protein
MGREARVAAPQRAVVYRAGRSACRRNRTSQADTAADPGFVVNPVHPRAQKSPLSPNRPHKRGDEDVREEETDAYGTTWPCC